MKNPNLNTSNAIASVETILEKMEKLRQTIKTADKADGVFLDELDFLEYDGNFFEYALKRATYVIDFAGELLETLERIRSATEERTESGP